MQGQRNVRLLQVPELDNTYQNVWDFANITNQANFFDSLTGLTTSANLKPDSKLTSLTIRLPFHQVKVFDYCYYTDDQGKRSYYFIINKLYNTSETTILELELDVWSTYLFDFQLLDSYVERCHVPRWVDSKVPTEELVDEGFALGDMFVTGRTVAYTMDPAFVIASTTPLGYLVEGGYIPDVGGDNGSNNACWLQGKPSRDGYRFMKGYEGFASYLYYDSGGTATIGYGVTPYAQEIFDKLVAMQPVPEEIAAQESYNLKIGNYGKPIVQRLKDLGCTKQQQFDALVDLAFNAGNSRVLLDNELTLAIKENPNNEPKIRAIWEKFVVTDQAGNYLEGLVARRKAECDIFFQGIYEKRAIVTVNQDGSFGPPVSENDGDGWLPNGCGDDLEPPTRRMLNSEGSFTIPAKGTVTAIYPTYPEGGVHNGVDIANSIGTPIFAPRKGAVLFVGPATGFGNMIEIDHGGGLISRMGHMYANGFVVEMGDTVEEGQQVAIMGNDGISTGPHVHIEFLKNGQYIQPSTNLSVGDIIE